MTGYGELLARAARAHTPLEVCVELTHRCTFRCAHCYVADFSAPDLLPTPRILALLEELAEAGTLYLTLSGGEALARPGWEAVARRARELGFFVIVLTNGFLVDEAVADTLADLPAKVEVSVYSTDDAVMDRITGVAGSARRARRAVALLKARGVEVVAKTPLMTLNHDALPGIAAWAETTGVPFKAFPVIVSRRDGNKAPLALRVRGEELRRFLAGPYYDCGEARAAGDDDPLCAAGRRFCTVTPAGDVVACTILPGSAGNLRERPFREIWDGSPWLARLRALSRADLDSCRGCAWRSACSRCPAQALVETGDLLAPLPASCERAEMITDIRRGRRALRGQADGRPLGAGGEEHGSVHRPPVFRQARSMLARASHAGGGQPVSSVVAGALDWLAERLQPSGDAAIRGLEQDLSRETTLDGSWWRLCETAWALGFVELHLVPTAEGADLLAGRQDFAPRPWPSVDDGEERPSAQSTWAFHLTAGGRTVATLTARRRLGRVDFEPLQLVAAVQGVIDRFVAVRSADGAPAAHGHPTLESNVALHLVEAATSSSAES